MDEVIISDAYHQIKEEIQRLQAVVAALTQERDELLYYICPELAARYAKEIGDYQNRINYQEMMILEIKRRIEIAQAALNREKAVSQEAVDEQIHKEYQEFHEKVNQQFEEAEDAKRQQRQREQQRQEYEQQWQERYGSESDTESSGNSAGDDTGESNGQDDSREDSGDDSQSQSSKGTSKKPPTAKELYRKIIKKLHPDVNPNVTEREKELFRKATEAYEKGDIATLQEIYDEVFGNADASEAAGKELTYDELVALKEKLTARIQSLKAEIEKIKAEFPYSKKTLLDNLEELKAKQESFNELIHQYEEEIKRLTAILESVNREMEELRRKNHGNA